MHGALFVTLSFLKLSTLQNLSGMILVTVARIGMDLSVEIQITIC